MNCGDVSSFRVGYCVHFLGWIGLCTISYVVLSFPGDECKHTEVETSFISIYTEEICCIADFLEHPL